MTRSEPNRRLLVLSLLELVAVRALLFCLGYRTTARVVNAVTPRPAPISGADFDANAIATAVERGASATPFRTTCLVEAVACQALLDAAGFETDLRVGVSKAEGALEAHAWLVHGDEVLVGATREDPERFRRLVENFEP